jgi:hypothetical protein
MKGEAVAGSLRQATGGRAIEHRFFMGLSLAILASAVLGFTRTYLLVPVLGLPDDALPFTPLVHLHAALSFGWCTLFVLQSWLIATGRQARHRQLGIVGVGWYLALVATGPVVALHAAARAGATRDELAFVAVSVGNVVAYTLLFGAGLLFRRRPPLHKRLMILGMVVMLSAPFGRLTSLPYQLDHVVGPGLVVAALAAWDWRALGRLHPVTGVGGVSVLAWELVPNLYMNHPGWLAVARSLVSVVAPIGPE